MIIKDVHEGIRKNKARKRVGRGPGSGHGKTSTRGHKGYGSRAGSSKRTGFEGGQTPLARRIAKRGFSNARFAKKVAIVNLSTLEAKYEAGETVSPATLKEKGILKGKYDVLKVLGDGELTKSLTVSAHRFSKSAAEAITKAGGTTETIALPDRTPKRGPKKTKPAPAAATPPASEPAPSADEPAPADAPEASSEAGDAGDGTESNTNDTDDSE